MFRRGNLFGFRLRGLIVPILDCDLNYLYDDRFLHAFTLLQILDLACEFKSPIKLLSRSEEQGRFAVYDISLAGARHLFNVLETCLGLQFRRQRTIIPLLCSKASLLNLDDVILNLLSLLSARSDDSTLLKFLPARRRRWRMPHDLWEDVLGCKQDRKI